MRNNIIKLLAISGTIIGTKTLHVLNKVLEEVKKCDATIETQLLDMKCYDVQFCDGRDPGAYAGDTKKVIDIVCSADFYLIGNTQLCLCSSRPFRRKERDRR